MTPGERAAALAERERIARLADECHAWIDWHKVPKALRDAIWAHYRPGQTALTCSPEYRDALHEVLTYARQASAGADGAR